jgi:uncharacterized protein YwqG
MWNNNDDYSESGEPLKLYLPKSPPLRLNTSPLESHIGGQAAEDANEEIPICAKCNDPMFLFAQLNLTEKRYNTFLCVFGCPKSECFDEVKFEKGFSSGAGVMSCKRRVTPIIRTEKIIKPVAPTKSSWYDDNGDDADNDWGLGTSNEETNISILENAVAAMEANWDESTISISSKPKPSKPKTESSSNSFDCYTLNQQNEPHATRQQVEEDDVGLSASDDKIRNMLARYMAEEEDEDILAALRGNNVGGGSGGGEEDERLSDEDRILLGFQDRLRRAPRQVIRYAKGGIPLWSIPSETKKKELFWSTPVCSCGNERTFEFQLLPSLLHVLKVDKYSGKDSESGIGGLLSNGMNWGSVAVFTCPKTNCKETEEALVIQEAVDKVNEIQGRPNMDFRPAIAVLEDMADDAVFKPDV